MHEQFKLSVFPVLIIEVIENTKSREIQPDSHQKHKLFNMHFTRFNKFWYKMPAVTIIF